MTIVPESTFTSPSSHCPNPELWSATDNQSTELEVTNLIAAFVVALRPKFVIETGTCEGNTAHAIGTALRAAGRGRLVTLEVDPNRIASATPRMAGLPVEIRRQSSLEYTPDEPVDFAFFDSEVPLRPLEFERYLPFMHSRTVVGFHDTGPQHQTRTLLGPLEARGILAPLYLPTPRGVCFSRVGEGITS